MAPQQTPNEATLYEAALSYLARYATTELRLRQVLERRIDRWRRSVEDSETADSVAVAARSAIAGVIARVVALGVVSDTEFAQSRARAMARSGRSSRAVAANLAARGVNAETARAAIEANETSELDAAVMLTRKRRIGAFRDGDPGDRNRELGVMARAGYPRDVAIRALEMDRETAEALIADLRR